MKIKTDFVTNSSSTSFVVMTKGQMTLQSFLVAVGVAENSVFVDIFKRLYHRFEHETQDAQWYAAAHGYASVEDLIESKLGKNSRERVKDAIANGYNVRIGELHSDNDEIECLFCCDAFVIEGDTILIDATDSGW